MAKKVVDKWKAKVWYTVLAPDMFDSKEIGEVPATEDEVLINRIIKTGLGELSGDRSKMYSRLLFRIDVVKGKTAYTKLIGHELDRDYLRMLARRRRSIVDVVQDVETKDGQKVRVKVSIFTARRVSNPLKTVMRAAIVGAIKAKAKDTNFNQFEQEAIFGKLSADIFGAIKKMAPVKRVEIRKTELHEAFTAAEEAKKAEAEQPVAA